MKQAIKIISSLTQVSLIACSLLLLPIQQSLAIDININELGKYKLNFEQISSVTTVSSNALMAQVTEKSGANFSVFLPFDVQQVNTLVTNGQLVAKHQKIAYLNGYDVHHFLDEFEAAKQLFTIAEKQYQSSSALYASKALKQSQWLEINNNYFSAKLIFEHLHHYMSFLNIDKNEKIAIIAPIAGIIKYSNTSDGNSKAEGELLFDIIPKSAIRLKVKVPLTNISNLAYLKIAKQQCKLAVNSKENIINDFTITIWSKPLNDECLLILGKQVIVTPIYQQNAFSINRTAVFEFKDSNYIAVKHHTQLNLVAINILNSTNDQFIFQSAIELKDKEALTSSVSAIQGMLLNLGDE
ncbi:MAG: HlyD family efflux transporter periplasmic adaptor subunit [Colwellia sp.]|nr:HlyD family efflux transporter periplasmic adaptor subunit [Colwellia sp.]